MFTTLVVPLDGSDFAAHALPTAAAIAAAGGAGLQLVGIARHDRDLAAVRRHVDGAARGVVPGVDVDIDVMLDPDPARVLLGLAADGRHVLCFASHDRGKVAALLLHSVGSTLLLRTRQPVLVVGVVDGAVVEADDVVVAVDGIHDPAPLVTAGAAWARQLRGPLRIVTVFEPAPADLDEPTHFSRRHGPPVDAALYLGALERSIDRDDLPAVSTAAVADAVSAADGLAEHLATQPARLVVAGHGPGIHDLLDALPVPLLVVPES
jgi:hypothetical protein